MYEHGYPASMGKSSRFWLAGPCLALVLVAVMIVPSTAVVGDPIRGNVPLPRASASSPPTPASTVELARAEASLSRGAGPADGSPLACGPSKEGGITCDGSVPSESKAILQGSAPSVGALSAAVPGVSTTAWNELYAIPQTNPPQLSDSGLVNDSKDGYLLDMGEGQDWKFSSGAWTRFAPAQTPPMSLLMSITYDAADGYVLAFGGENASNQVGNQTWSYSGGVWTNLSSSISQAPTPRDGAAMAYDAADHEVVLFGGTAPGVADLGDTWVYRAGVWTPLSPSSPPPGRYGAAMAYDYSINAVLLFGGYGSTGDLSDTWKFSGGTWTQLAPATSPPARYDGYMAYDAHDDEDVLFGGDGGTYGYQIGDTWTYKAGTWTEVSTTTGPWPSAGAMLTYDPAANSVVLLNGGAFEYTWEFSGGSWTYVSTFPTDQPPPGYLGTMCWDGADNAVLLFGGTGGDPDSTWEFQDGNWTEVSVTTAPPPREYSSMTYDAGDGYVVLFGGLRLAPFGLPVYFGDTWTFKAGVWTNITSTANGPPVRGFSAMSYDGTDGYVVLFGGASFTAVYDDTWTFHAGKWTQLSPTTHPWISLYSEMSNDTADGYLLFLPGFNYTRGTFEPYVWKFVGGAWTNITASVTNPIDTVEGALAWDPSADDVLAYEFVLGMYTYSASKFTQLPAGYAPELRTFPDLAEDTTDHGDLLVDGTAFYLPGFTFPGDTWLYAPTTPQELLANATATGTKGAAPLTATFTSTITGGTGPYHYAWNFGDGGGTSGAADPVHVYNGTGTYIATLYVVDAAGRHSAAYVEVVVNPPMIASIGASPSSGYVPLTVDFTGTALYGTSPYTYNWTFGDGPKGSTYVDPTHTYNSTGVFPVRFTAVDAHGVTRVAWTNITVTVPPPLAANATASVYYGDAPLTVQYTGTGTGGSGTYTGYAWNFGDATTSAQQDPSHTYNSAGRYAVVLAVTDSLGATAYSYTNVTAVIAPLSATSSASATEGVAPLQVVFSSSISGGTGGYVYAWTFGDSASSGYSSPTHTYNASGSYTVQLTVHDNVGDTATALPLAVHVGPALHLSLTTNVSSGTAPLWVSVNEVPEGGWGSAQQYSYEISFGDGSFASSENATHEYASPGDWQVQGTVTDALGDTATAEETVDVGAPALHATAAASPSVGVAPLDVHFSASASGGAGAFSYAWTFGNGGTASLQDPSGAFEKAGSYTNYVVVSDSFGQSATAWANVTVNAPLTATLSASPTSGTAPLTVSFTGAGAGGVPPYSFTMVFGDGTSSGSASPTHTFNASGDFQVVLTVKDHAGTSALASVWVNVSAAAPGPASSFLGLPLYEGLGLVLVLVVAAIAVVALRRSKRKREGEGGGPPPTSTPGEPQYAYAYGPGDPTVAPGAPPGYPGPPPGYPPTAPPGPPQGWGPGGGYPPS